MIWFVAGLAALFAVSVWAYNFLEGETLIRDLFDEARLSRTDLNALDAAWATAPSRRIAW